MKGMKKQHYLIIIELEHLIIENKQTTQKKAHKIKRIYNMEINTKEHHIILEGAFADEI